MVQKKGTNFNHKKYKKKIDSRNLFYYKRFHINLQVTGIEQSRYSLVFYRSMKVKCDKNQ